LILLFAGGLTDYNTLTRVSNEVSLMLELWRGEVNTFPDIP